jgi:hypothetical protein
MVEIPNQKDDSRKLFMKRELVAKVQVVKAGDAFDADFAAMLNSCSPKMRENC